MNNSKEPEVALAGLTVNMYMANLIEPFVILNEAQIQILLHI